MSAKQKARLVILPVLLTMLFVTLRYTMQSVDLYTLLPDLRVDQIDVLVNRFVDGPESRTVTLRPEDPAFDTVLTQLEDLRFQRSAMGPMLQSLPFLDRFLSGGSKNVDDGEITTLSITLVQDNGDGTWRTEDLEFWVDEWSYRDFDHDVNLPLNMSHGKTVGQELGQSLWEIAGESKSNS